MKIRRNNALSAIALLTLLLPAMASAAIKATQISEDEIKIGFNISELSSEEGRLAVESQISSAARKLCGSSGVNKLSLHQQIEARTCYKQAVDEALSVVNKELSAS